MKKGFILLPGAGMSDWLWKKLIPLLNHEAISIPRRLETNSIETRLKASFSDIISYTNQVIESSGLDEVILVGHSGAGLMAGAVGKMNDKVKHIIFIAANIPMHGTTAIDALPEEIKTKNIEAVKAQAAYDFIPMKGMEQVFRNMFCNTSIEEDIVYVLEQNFQPEPVCILLEKMDWSDYPEKGRTYIICTNDKTLPEKHQELMASNLAIADLRRINSDHMVMISHAEELAKELNEIIDKYQ